MANTFKFGNGNWAVKDGSALAYNDENNNFKPLPFDFTRASSATRVNKQGLIETVPSGKPRIDFLNNTSGHLLLEPNRQNKSQWSEDFSNSIWGKTSVSVLTNQTVSPDGSVTADRIIESTATGSHDIRQNESGLSSSTQYTYSVFVKAYEGGSYRNVSFYVGGINSTGTFSFNTGTFTTHSFDKAKAVNYGNGWYRLEITDTTIGTTFNTILLTQNGTTTNYTGDGSSGFYLWGSQFEQGSYATSYIPTEGSSVTRVVDDIQLVLPDVDSFNSSSGFSVISKFDIGETSGSSSVPFLFFNDDTSGTYMAFGSNTTNLRCRLNLSGTSYLNTQSNAPRTQKNSLFMSCDSSGWSQGANGSTNHTGTNNASVFDRLASITFVTSETYGIIKISELLVYNTRLTNTELQNLTS